MDFRTPHAPNQSGRGGRTATTKFYALRDNLALGAAPEPTRRLLTRAREWLERNARTIAAVILLLLAVVLMRNGIAGLTA
jgi:hypothetical protein